MANSTVERFPPSETSYTISAGYLPEEKPASAPIPSIADTNYYLRRGGEEVDRLTRQHLYIKNAFNREKALPPTVDPNSISTVLDVGAGNLVWTLDLARTPEIHSRLPSTRAASSSSEPVQLYACDLSTSQFPPSQVTDPIGVNLFEHDVTKPFPEELKDKFDLVHMRLLLFALSEEGWGKALRNLRDVLKPGGTLLLTEVNSTVYRKDWDLFRCWTYQHDKTHRDLTNWIDRTNDVMDRCVMGPNGFIPDLAFRLPSLIKSSGLSVTSSNPVLAPAGRACVTRNGASGQPFESEEQASAYAWAGAIDAALSSALKNGLLMAPGSGEKLRPEEGDIQRQLSDDLKNGLVEEGAMSAWIEVIARKL